MIGGYRQHPRGWTSAGSKPGFIRVERTPQDMQIKKLGAENEELRAMLGSLMERLEHLEQEKKHHE